MNNDKMISEIQERIALKRDEIGQKPEFEPATSCKIRMGTGEWINIKTASEDVLISLLIDLNGRRMSADDLGIPYQIGGQAAIDWITDIKSALARFEYEQESDRLQSLEYRLKRLLSDKTKREQAIRAIADEVDA